MRTHLFAQTLNFHFKFQLPQLTQRLMTLKVEIRTLTSRQKNCLQSHACGLLNVTESIGAVTFAQSE